MKYWSIVGFCLVLVFASGASAGALNGHAAAMSGWTGSTSFAFDDGDPGVGLEGYIDFAIFAPGAFPYGGYTPTTDEAVYAYQVFAEGTDHISAFTVALNGPADNIGSSSVLGGVVPSATLLVSGVGGMANWDFNSGIDPLDGENSCLLLLSSPQIPENLFGLTVNGGHQALVIPLPTPGPEPIPEPATWASLVCALLAVACMWRRRR